MNIAQTRVEAPAIRERHLADWLIPGPIDALLCCVAALLFLTPDTVLYFHLVFICLTIGGFFWKLGPFIARSIFWVALTTGGVLLAVMRNRTQPDELIEIPLLCAILVGVFLLARHRAQVQSRVAAALSAEQEHVRRLSELAVLKADFTAIVAHELGSPLLAIRSFAELLRDDRLPREAQLQMIESIRSEVAALTAIVADVQSSASVERDDFEVVLRPTPVRALMADAAAYAQSLSGDHPVEVEGALDTLVLADRDRVGQVLRNLLKNAAAYSAPGMPITLRASQEGHSVRIEIADRGTGIHPDDIARVFEKFGRGRSVDGERVAGVGLGLYLSRRIVRAHGSDLTVRSLLGVGSVFAFSLEQSP